MAIKDNKATKKTYCQKKNQIIQVIKLLQKYKTVIFANIENVSTPQIQQTRVKLQKLDSKIIIIKNTMMIKALNILQNPQSDKNFTEYVQSPLDYSFLNDMIQEKLCYVFTNQPVDNIKQILEEITVEAPAKAGSYCNKNITIPAGPTGMDPSNINFFHQLNVQTKINKGQIEIIADYLCCKEGTVINNSQVALLNKMNMKPFTFGIVTEFAMTEGKIITKEILNTSQDDLKNIAMSCINSIAAISMEVGYTNEISIPHLIISAFKNVCALGKEIGYEFEQLKNIGSGSVAGNQAAQQDAQEEPQEEEDMDMDMGDMFG